MKIINTSSKGQIRVDNVSLRGNDYIDVRAFYQNSDGEWLPTKKGVTVPADKADQLIAALTEALAPAKAQSVYAVLLFTEADLKKYRAKISVPSSMCFAVKSDAKKALPKMRKAGYETAFLCKITFTKCEDTGGAKIISSPKYKTYSKY